MRGWKFQNNRKIKYLSAANFLFQATMTPKIIGRIILKGAFIIINATMQNECCIYPNFIFTFTFARDINLQFKGSRTGKDQRYSEQSISHKSSYEPEQESIQYRISHDIQELEFIIIFLLILVNITAILNNLFIRRFQVNKRRLLDHQNVPQSMHCDDKRSNGFNFPGKESDKAQLGKQTQDQTQSMQSLKQNKRPNHSSGKNGQPSNGKKDNSVQNLDNLSQLRIPANIFPLNERIDEAFKNIKSNQRAQYQSLSQLRSKISQRQANNDTKVSLYLEGINKYNEMFTKGSDNSNIFYLIMQLSKSSARMQATEVTILIFRQADLSMYLKLIIIQNGQDNGSGGSGSGFTGSNMAFLDSTAGQRNISGSNAAGSGNSGSNGSNVQFVPVLIVCCPNLLKNEACGCGHQQSVQIPVNGSVMNHLINALNNPQLQGSVAGGGGGSGSTVQNNSQSKGAGGPQQTWTSFLTGSALSRLNQGNNSSGHTGSTTQPMQNGSNGGQTGIAQTINGGGGHSGSHHMINRSHSTSNYFGQNNSIGNYSRVENNQSCNNYSAANQLNLRQQQSISASGQAFRFNSSSQSSFIPQQQGNALSPFALRGENRAQPEVTTKLPPLGSLGLSNQSVVEPNLIHNKSARLHQNSGIFPANSFLQEISHSLMGQSSAAALLPSSSSSKPSSLINYHSPEGPTMAVVTGSMLALRAQLCLQQTFYNEIV